MDPQAPSLNKRGDMRGVHSTGRPLQPLSDMLTAPARGLTERDIETLETFGPSELSTLGKIRERHHSIARLLALGLTNVEVAGHVGCTKERVYTLTKSPLFADLVAQYRDKVTRRAIQLGLVQKVQAVSEDYLEALHRRLTEEADEIPFRHLSTTTMALLDRAGVGPTSRVENARGGISDADLATIKARIKDEEIDITPLSAPLRHEPGNGGVQVTLLDTPPPARGEGER